MTDNLGEIGELRQNIVTGQWVVIATTRAKRPHDARSVQAPAALPKYKTDCPFCNTAQFTQEATVLRLPDDDKTWQARIFGNKYPAFVPRDEFRTWQTGPYRAMEAVGYHEVLITKDHNQIEIRMTQRQLAQQLEALVLRYRQLKTKASVNYIQIIKNHGQVAGGSLEHPHHQIFTTPILPDDVHTMLRGVERYAAQHHDACLYADIMQFERTDGRRIVYENEAFVAFCPYASQAAFEVTVMPRHRTPFFENMDPKQRELLADVMRQVLGRLYTGLNDPPYNYYILSAPCDSTGFVCNEQTFQHFSWHINIAPRLGVWGGFELGTGIIITTVAPEEAAEFLRAQAMPTLA